MPIVSDMDQVAEFAERLGSLAKRAIPRAARLAVNDAAFALRLAARDVMRSDFILRNRWVLGSMAVTKATQSRLDQIESAAGSRFAPMAEQDIGGVVDDPTLPTTVASGEGQGARPRRRLPRGKANLRRMPQFDRVTPRNPSGGRAQELAVALRQARASGVGAIKWQTRAGKTALFRVSRLGAKRPRVELTHVLSAGSLRLRPQRWLARALARINKQVPHYFAARLHAEVQRALGK